MVSEAAKEQRREYMRKYRQENRAHINAYKRAWHKRPENQGKAKEYTDLYKYIKKMVANSPSL